MIVIVSLIVVILWLCGFGNRFFQGKIISENGIDNFVERKKNLKELKPLFSKKEIDDAPDFIIYRPENKILAWLRGGYNNPKLIDK